MRNFAINTLPFRRSYSTHSVSPSPSSCLPPPIKIFYKLEDNASIISYQGLLKDKAGIYCFFNTVNNMQYIGSAKDLYLRLVEHLSGKKSNVALQRAIAKHGLDKFHFYIYEYFYYTNKLISNKALTDLETSYLEKFDFKTLYNFKKTATSLKGYKHTEQAMVKMLNRFISKHNQPMYGKPHTQEARKLIVATQKNEMSKHIQGIGIYDFNLVKKFKNNVELAKHINISKVTAGKYLKSGQIFNKTHYFKVNKT